MKKTYITALIVLISVSLVGLVAIQIYWIKNAIALRDTQFARNVKMAIADFNHELELAEANERIRKHEFGQRLLSQFDSISALQKSEKYVVAQEFNDGDSTVVYSEDGLFQFKFNKRTSSTRFSDFGDYDPAFGNVPEALDKTSSPRFFSDEQTALVAELFSGILLMEVGGEFVNNYTADNLDSLLERSLVEIGGVNADFHFGVFDRFDNAEIIGFEDKDFSSDIIAKGYRTRLFPADNVQNPRYLRIWFPNQDSYLLKTLWPLLFSSAVFMLTVILAFGFTISTILRQKKVSEIKNDFINNMTHELKTPISTISLACEALADPVMSRSQARVGHYVSMIRDENKRLGVLVENVLRSAVLDRKEISLERDSVDMHQVIITAIHNIELQAQQKGGKIGTELSANQAVIKGDKIHLTNVIYNLLDNAIKYSNENPDIKVSSSTEDSTVIIQVIDNGIGIKKDDQQRIFDKLYRVSTGNVHNIKGFGLGLSYVKMIIEKHHGTVSVQSDFGKGSIFTIQLPFDYDL